MPSEGRGRRFESFRVRHFSNGLAAEAEGEAGLRGRIYPTQPGRIWPTAIILALLTAALVGIAGWVRLSNGGCPALAVIGDALRLAGCGE